MNATKLSVALGAIVSLAALQGCGGGGGGPDAPTLAALTAASSGGSTSTPDASKPSDPITTPDKTPTGDPSTKPSNPATPETPVTPVTPDPGTPTPPQQPGSSFLQRAIDTVNPLAADGFVDVRFSPDFVQLLPPYMTLETVDGTKVADVAYDTSFGGNPFPRTRTLQRLHVPRVAPGRYVLRAKANPAGSASTAAPAEATMPLQIGTFNANLVSLSTAPKIFVGGSSRFINFRYFGSAGGTAYLYAKGEPMGVCEAKTATELAAMPNVIQQQLDSSGSSSTESYLGGSAFADADTACIQFVNVADGVAEPPYTFNVRFQPRTSSDDVILALLANVETLDKQSLSLAALPVSVNASGFFDWFNRRQVYAEGDVGQQPVANGERITLEQDAGSWQYRLAAPLASDPAFYIANVEGRPPLVFFAGQ